MIGPSLQIFNLAALYGSRLRTVYWWALATTWTAVHSGFSTTSGILAKHSVIFIFILDNITHFLLGKFFLSANNKLNYIINKRKRYSRRPRLSDTRHSANKKAPSIVHSYRLFTRFYQHTA